MDTTITQTRLVKKKALAVMLAVSVRTIDNWVAQRLIPFLAPSPRLHLFDPDGVKRALATRFEVQAKVPAGV